MESQKNKTKKTKNKKQSTDSIAPAVVVRIDHTVDTDTGYIYICISRAREIRKDEG
jgi:hypothetical protein